MSAVVSDRGLLELAAKAAGIELENIPMMGAGLLLKKGGVWNPLADDGDALRLAVRLGLFNDEDFVAELKAIWMYSCTDYYAATRRAIVRAAAEIGKAMP